MYIAYGEGVGGEGGVVEVPTNEVHGGGSDESCDEGICGFVVDVFGSSDLLDFAFAHDDDSVCKCHGFDLVMGDVDGGGFEFSLEIFELCARGDSKFCVEVGEGFIHEEDVGFTHDGTSKGDTLSLSS